MKYVVLIVLLVTTVGSVSARNAETLPSFDSVMVSIGYLYLEDHNSVDFEIGGVYEDVNFFFSVAGFETSKNRRGEVYISPTIGKIGLEYQALKGDTFLLGVGGMYTFNRGFIVPYLSLGMTIEKFFMRIRGGVGVTPEDASFDGPVAEASIGLSF